MSTDGFSIVVAMDRKRGIGYKGDLPWPKLKGDMKFFRELTTCPDRAAVEKRWGLKAEESADVQAWPDVLNMLKFAHPLPAASDEKRNAVIMGRKTWESLPENYRPLPDRHNRVMSRVPRIVDDLTSGENSPVRFIEESVTGYFREHPIPEFMPAIHSSEVYRYPQIFVIGGGQIFVHSLRYLTSKHIYITEIDADFPCDTFFPETPDFKPALSSPWIDEGGVRYRFRRYDRV